MIPTSSRLQHASTIVTTFTSSHSRPDCSSPSGITTKNKTSKTTAFLIVAAIVMASSAIIAHEMSSHGAYAQGQGVVAVSSVALEETVLLTITNTESQNAQGVSTFQIWLAPDAGAAFASFKTESGWVGQKDASGSIVFTSAIPLRLGESAKFGIETDIPVKEINWRAMDQNGDDMGSATTVPNSMLGEQDPPKDGTDTPPPASDDNTDNKDTDVQPPTPPRAGITSESDFRLIPAKPSVGAKARIVGEGFGQDMSYDFYMNNRILGGIVSGGDGRFVATMQIPSDMPADRVNFVMRDAEGKEVVRSIRLNPAEQRLSDQDSTDTGSQTNQISISGIPDMVKIGDRLSVKGTGTPDGTVIAYVTGPDASQVSADVARVDSNGMWSIPVKLVGADMKVGTYSTTVTDGTHITQKTWSITIEQKATLEATKIRYERGDTMGFNFTSDKSDSSVKIQIEDPNDIIIYSNILDTDTNGVLLFEYKTEYSNKEGTYTLTVSQDDYKEFLFVGLGELPKIKIRFELDKINYKSTDTAVITIAAKPSDTLRLNILDQSDNIAYTEAIDVQSDGRGIVTLNLAEFEDGIYTAEVEKGTEKTSKEFTIGLQSGTTNIEITPIKPPYYIGEQFQVSIDTGDTTVPITITITDPDGKTVSSKETFSEMIRVNKDEDRSKAIVNMQIPESGVVGTWTITVESGGNTHSVPIDVIPDGMSVYVQDIARDPTIGTKYVDIVIIGAKQSVWIEVTSQDGTPIGGRQTIPTTDEDKAVLKWKIPDDIISGKYIFKAEDIYGNTARTEIDLEN